VSHRPSRYALNQRVFSQPRPIDLATLRDAYRVKWLLAGRRAPGGVAAALGSLAKLRFTAGSAAVYQL
jgi:hypothetical protein